MFGTAIHPSRTQRAIARNLGLDLVAAVGVGVSLALVTSLLPTIARRGGLEPMGLAALAAAPFVANLLGAFAGRYGPRSPRQLALIRGAGAASLIVLLVLPVPQVMVLVALVSWLSISFGGPFHLRLWGAMYPARLRGRIVGVIGTGRSAAAAMAALAGGLIADQLGGPAALAIAGAIGAVCAFAYAGFHASAAADPPVFSARESIRALRSRPVLGRVALAQGFYGGGLIAAAPLFALVYVDRLDLSLADVGVIGILTAASTTVSFVAWGMVSDRFGALVAMRIGTSLGLLGLVAYAGAPSVAVLWAASIAFGIASSSIDVGIAAIVSENTTLETRAAAMAGWNAITGARGVVAAFLMSALLTAGVVDVTGGLLLCATATAIGVVLYVRADATESATSTADPVAAEPATGAGVERWTRGGLVSGARRLFAK